MITELARTDTDLRRPLTGDSAATSNDGAETDSSGAFSAILAPMSVDGARTAGDGQPSPAHRSAQAGCSGPCTDHSVTADASLVTQAANRHSAPQGVAAQERSLLEATGDNLPPAKMHDELSVNTVLGESWAEAGAEPALQTNSPQDGNSGKLLPPGGKDAQPLDLAADAIATGDGEWVEAGQGLEAQFDQGETASVAAAITGGSIEAAQSRQSIPGSETQQQAASADPLAAVTTASPRRAGASNADTADAPSNTITLDSVGESDVPERNISARALRASAEPVPQARGGDAGNPMVSAGGGVFADASAEASPLAERGQAATGAELRSGDRLLTDRPGGELTSGDRAPRLAVQQFAGQPGWGEEIQGKLQWLSRQGIHRAELQLHPAELGSIEVRITAEQDQTSVIFVAANRTARELLEAEIPRLRELFSQAGVELGQAEVSDRQSGDREFAAREESFDQGHRSQNPNGAETAETPMEDANLLSVGSQGSRGLIDYYI